MFNIKPRNMETTFKTVALMIGIRCYYDMKEGIEEPLNQ